MPASSTNTSKNIPVRILRLTGICVRLKLPSRLPPATSRPIIRHKPKLCLPILCGITFFSLNKSRPAHEAKTQTSSKMLKFITPIFCMGIRYKTKDIPQKKPNNTTSPTSLDSRRCISAFF